MKILKRRVWGLRLLTWLRVICLAPILLWVLLNALFSTPLGTGMIEKRIEGRLRVSCEIDSVTWSPWAGVTIRNFRLLSPEGVDQRADLLAVDEIEIDLSWSSLLEGRKRWERLEMRGVRVEVSIEALKAILDQFHVAPIPNSVGGEVIAESPESRPTVVGNDPEVESEESAAQPVIREAPSVVESVPVDDFQGVVIFSDASLHIYSEKVPELSLKILEVSGELPIWGETREGKIELPHLEVGEGLVEKGLVMTTAWKDNVVIVESGPVKAFGINLNVNGALRMGAGFPVGVQVDLPTQQMDLTPLFGEGASPIQIEKVTSRNTLQGYLLKPASLRGSSVTRFRELVFSDLRDGGETSFERGLAILSLSSAGVIAKDIRVIGDDDAILMNGFATVGGEAAATVRIVSSPERASSHENRVKRGGRHLSLDFEPLVTPDREYRDVRIEHRGGGLMVNLAENREWVPFFPLVKAVLGRENTELPKLP